MIFYHLITSQWMIVAVPSSGRHLLWLFHDCCLLFTDLYLSWCLEIILKVSMNEFVPVYNSSLLPMTINIRPFLSWLIAEPKFFLISNKQLKCKFVSLHTLPVLLLFHHHFLGAAHCHFLYLLHFFLFSLASNFELSGSE
jgi:hypothetical protein